MPIVPLTCPACGAQLQVNSDDAILTCSFCGVSSVMKDAIVHNYIQNTVNITAGTVNVVNQKDFVIEGGVLKKYQGESMEVVIPDNVVAIGESAFQGLRIKSVKIPNSVTEIGYGAFSGCTSLTSVTIPSSVKKIGWHAFEGCTSLTSVTIPNSVKVIGHSAFSGCTSLTSVTIPSSVTEFGDWAFEDCTKLTSVTIQCSVTKIRYNAFEGTPYLKNIVAAERRRQGRCQHCGGDFTSIFKKCVQCGKPKDY